MQFYTKYFAFTRTPIGSTPIYKILFVPAKFLSQHFEIIGDIRCSGKQTCIVKFTLVSNKLILIFHSSNLRISCTSESNLITEDTFRINYDVLDFPIFLGVGPITAIQISSATVAGCLLRH